MIDATIGLRQAAIKHLDLFRATRARENRTRDLSDRYWVELAFSKGLDVSEISEHSGLELEHVRTILRGE